MHSFVMKSLDGLDSDYVEPIRATPVEGILQPCLQMRDMVPPPLPKGRVTLLGDAVHPMVPCKSMPKQPFKILAAKTQKKKKEES